MPPQPPPLSPPPPPPSPQLSSYHYGQGFETETSWNLAPHIWFVCYWGSPQQFESVRNLALLHIYLTSDKQVWECVPHRQEGKLIFGQGATHEKFSGNTPKTSHTFVMHSNKAISMMQQVYCSFVCVVCLSIGAFRTNCLTAGAPNATPPLTAFVC